MHLHSFCVNFVHYILVVFLVVFDVQFIFIFIQFIRFHLSVSTETNG